MLKSYARDNLIVIAGSASSKLAAKVAKQLKCPFVKPELKHPPHGETYVRIGAKLKGAHAIVVQSTSYPQNDNLMELFFLLGAAKDSGARRVTAVVPYLAYARQSKRYEPGEAISAQTICKLIGYEADELFVVDIHDVEIMKNFLIPARDLSAVPLLGQYFSSLNLKRPLILGPDQKAFECAHRAAVELGAESDYLTKKRITPTKVITQTKSLDVAGRDVVIIDDIISTGGTIIEATKSLKQCRARRIYVACTHAVLVGNALQKITAAGVTKVIATDTINTRVSVVSVAPVIAEAIRKCGG